MTPMNDPQLVELFVEEIRERAMRLLRNARAWRDGEWRGETAEEAERDAHTIKGNADYMADQPLVALAKMLEATWSEVRTGARAFDEEVADAIVAAAQSLVAAVSSPPKRDPDGLEALVRLVGGDNPFLSAGPSGQEETFYALARDLPDLGGLVVDSVPHFLDEMSSIDTARLGRLVDAIAQQRLDTEALISALQESLGAEGAGEWQAATSSLLSSARTLFDEAAGLTGATGSLITDTLGQLVRYIARRSGKDVALIVDGEDAEADRYILDALREPIRHLVVNAIEHGIEAPSQRLAASKPRAGRIHIRFTTEDDVLVITVEDDGRGIRWSRVAEEEGLDTDAGPALLNEALFGQGFSTAEVPTQFSGDGAGLALVARVVESLDGAVSISSDPARGTTVTVRLPRLRAMQGVAVVESRGQRWGLPVTAVVDVVEALDDRIDATGRRFAYGDRHIPYASLSHILRGPGGTVTEVVVLAGIGTELAVGIEGGIRRRRGVAKQLGPSLKGVDLLSGAALLGGGDFVAMLDRRAIAAAATAARPEQGPRPRILVVDDSRAARLLLAASLTSAGFDVVPFFGGPELLSHPEIWTASLIVTDLDMPGQDGVQLIEAIRARGIGTPICVLSGVGSESELQRALDAGADLTFEKAGFREGAFVDAVRDLVKDRRKAPTHVVEESSDDPE